MHMKDYSERLKNSELELQVSLVLALWFYPFFFFTESDKQLSVSGLVDLLLSGIRLRNPSTPYVTNKSQLLSFEHFKKILIST